MQRFMSKIAPKNIMIAGFILFMGGAFLTGGFFPSEIEAFNEQTLLNWSIFALIRDAGAVLAAGTIIISGLRSIRIQGSSRRRVAMVLTGIGIGLLFLTLSSIAAIQLGNMLKSYDFSRMIALIESKLQQENLSQPKRDVLRLKLAESRYLQSGEQILVPAGEDRQKIYEPSQATIEFKKNVDFSRQIYGLLRQWAHDSIYVWIGVLLFSTVAGAVSRED